MAKVTAPENVKNAELDKTDSIKEIVPNKRIDEQINKPGKYEIQENESFKIDLYLAQRENRWVIVDEANKNLDKVVHHWVEFRMWTFEDEIVLKKQATTYDALKRIHFVDNDLLNRLKIQKYLKAWSFEKENQRLKLLHVNGVLADESYYAFMKLQPNIVRNIIEEMNNILEYNQ